jgi:UDP-3-O-[3-hydroxymyristoyl] glucosamine N-acyltransferase
MPDVRFYKKQGIFSLKMLAEKSGAEWDGNPNFELHDIASLEKASSTEICAVMRKEGLESLPTSKAGAYILNPDYKQQAPKDANLILTKTPYKTFAAIMRIFYPFPQAELRVQSMEIHPSAKIGEGCLISPGAYIGEGAEIGENTYIGPNVIIGHGVIIGHRCVVHSGAHISYTLMGNGVTVFPGASLGQTGFGFVMDTDGPVDMPQLGRVIVGDNVRIGANTTIDRGTLGDTVIGSGCRIDNLVQIAHNVQLGRGCIIVAQVGIAGSTKIGDFAAIAGQAGLTEHLNIGKNVRIAAQSGVLRDVPEGETIGGSPAVPVKEWRRQCVILSKLARKS